jgi:hypothetical protein
MRFPVGVWRRSGFAHRMKALAHRIAAAAQSVGLTKGRVRVIGERTGLTCSLVATKKKRHPHVRMGSGGKLVARPCGNNHAGISPRKALPGTAAPLASTGVAMD